MCHVSFCVKQKSFLWLDVIKNREIDVSGWERAEFSPACSLFSLKVTAEKVPADQNLKACLIYLRHFCTVFFVLTVL